MAGDLCYDPSQPDFQDRLHAIYRTLRDEHPVHFEPATREWLLSRHEDVRAAACDHASFSSEGTDLSRGLLPMIQSLDPPRHDALRARVLQVFTAKRISLLEPEIRRIARELLEAFAGAGRGDLVADFARQLPSRVIGALIGIPPTGARSSSPGRTRWWRPRPRALSTSASATPPSGSIASSRSSSASDAPRAAKT